MYDKKELRQEENSSNYLREVKARLIKHCLQIAKEKVKALESELGSTREAAGSEDKSTAGDKHETGRAMMHLEQEKLYAQLDEAETLVAELQRIDPKSSSVTIQLGTLVFTDKANFLITAGLGRVRFENGDYFVVSAQSPVAQAMIGKKCGEEFVVNGTRYQIKSIE